MIKQPWGNTALELSAGQSTIHAHNAHKPEHDAQAVKQNPRNAPVTHMLITALGWENWELGPTYFIN